MPHSTLRRSVRAGLAVIIAISGSVLLAPASPAATDSARVAQPRQSTPAPDDSERHPHGKTVRLRQLKGAGSGSGTATVQEDGTITVVIDGAQHFTHLGWSTWHLEGVCTNPACTSSIATTVNVAADGDRLIFVESTVNGVSTFTVTGGTGRFKGATGSAATTGTLTFDPNNPLAFTTTFESVGTIVFGRNLS